jgi:uncharacterized protein (DUF433 family)
VGGTPKDFEWIVNTGNYFDLSVYNFECYICLMHTLSDYISVDKEIQFGKPVFKGTRVPVQSLFWHLEKGIPLNDFLEDFPSVSQKQAEAVIEWSAKHFELPEIISDETVIG